MKKAIKIVTIGGGSSYTPELMEGFIRRYEEMSIREIWLVDVEEGKEKLEIVGAMAKRMWQKSGYDVKIHLTLNRQEALKNADFVTTQLRVGGLQARIMDERIPLSYGMAGQETNGAGGIFKAFRTIPVMLDIVEDMKKLCPDAWLINFTNPSGMITEAVIRYGKWQKVLGLCNIPVQAILDETRLLEKNKTDLIFRFGGLNHFHWHKVYDENGSDVTKQLIEKTRQAQRMLPANIHAVQESPFSDKELIGCPYHLYYDNAEEMLAHLLEEYQSTGTRAEQVSKTEQELFELYKDASLDHQPEQLKKRGGAHYSDAACETIAAVYNNKHAEMVVSTQNHGAISFLDDDCVVEVSSLIGANGADPICVHGFSYAQKGMLMLMKQMELCICEAAVKGSYALAMDAFRMNPLIPAGKSAKNVLDELLIAHEKHLPQFKEIIEAIKPTMTIKDEKVMKLLQK